MNTLTNLFSNNLIEAVGFTFLHSIWQIAIIALCLKCLLIYVQKPKMRYALSLSALALVFFCSLYTFYLSYPESATKVSSQTAIIENISFNNTLETKPAETLKYSFNINNLKAYFPILFNVWILGFLYLSLKNIAGLWYIRKIKQDTTDAPDQLKVLVRQYQNRLQIRKTIEVMASKMVESPAVVGFFKPVILIPVQMLTGTSYDYLKAILAHEIAHIYRHDFIVNIMQSMVMSLFYYHPFAWWINNQINESREQSCDDIAISLCNDKLLYSKALLEVSEMQASKLVLAQTFYKNKKTLLNRIQRLLKNSNQKSNKMEKIIAISLIVGALATYTFGFSKQSKITSTKTMQLQNTANTDSLSKEKEIKAFSTNKFKEYKFGIVTCTVNNVKYELDVVDGIYYYKDKIIPLKPNRTITLKTENEPIQLAIKNDTIQFLNATELRTCWSNITQTWGNINETEKADLQIDAIPKSDSVKDSKKDKSVNKLNEGYNNMIITPLLNDGSTYNLEVEDSLYYHNGIHIPLQPDRTVTIDTENGPLQLILENDSMQFGNAIGIKYDWGIEYYKVQNLNPDSSKIINDSIEEKQKPNDYPIFLNTDTPLSELYELGFKNLVTVQLLEDGFVAENEAFTFMFTNKAAQLNNTKLGVAQHHKFKELYKISYQTDIVPDEVSIEVTEQ